MSNVLRRSIISPIVLAALLVSGVVVAQQWWSDPNFAGTQLTAGFPNDPHVMTNLTFGGGSNPQNVSELGLTDPVTGEACVGFVTRSPDFRFIYTAGSFPLRFYMVAQPNADGTVMDAMMLVNDPNGNWRCSDDSHGTLNPTIDFATPISGQYDVWVGSYDGSSHNNMTFYITELPNQYSPANPQ